jgi:hypothetical protein
MDEIAGSAEVSVLPTEGVPVGLTLDARTVYVWWGPDDRGNDVVAARGNAAIVSQSSEQCWTLARERLWPGHDDEEISASAAPVLDFDPALDWLRGRRFVLDFDVALNLWNTAADLARSTNQQWADRGSVRDQCYDKLFVANVPWVAGRDAIRPRWSTRELDTLRATLSDAVRVTRAALAR